MQMVADQSQQHAIAYPKLEKLPQFGRVQVLKGIHNTLPTSVTFPQPSPFTASVIRWKARRCVSLDISTETAVTFWCWSCRTAHDR